jgi:hypothetical protein
MGNDVRYTILFNFALHDINYYRSIATDLKPSITRVATSVFDHDVVPHAADQVVQEFLGNQEPLLTKPVN